VVIERLKLRAAIIPIRTPPPFHQRSFLRERFIPLFLDADDPLAARDGVLWLLALFFSKELPKQ
jgi:hypothetical protein